MALKMCRLIVFRRPSVTSRSLIPLQRLSESLSLSRAVVRALRSATSSAELTSIMEEITREINFKYFALAHHDNATDRAPNRVRLMQYPPAIVERLVDGNRYHSDPVVRGCAISETAFLWSTLNEFIAFGPLDRKALAEGRRHGLNEGISIPILRTGEAVASCTFAGTARPDRVELYLGVAQMIGAFAFQAARRLLIDRQTKILPAPRLHPRPRDCVVLAGCGFSNKEIARALAITPRTVDGYLTQARRLFGAHDRTELVITAVLAGEVGLHELRRRQPE